MTGLLVVLALIPAVLAPFAVGRGRVGRAVRAMAPWAALPALAVALVPGPLPTVRLEWLLLGADYGLDTVGQIFLLFTALLWTVAGVYARGYLAHDLSCGRYFLFHLLTLSGNLGLILSQDLVSFYLFFALMTFSAYGLVIHVGTAAALRAGRVYIVMAVLGESLLLAGLMLAAAHSPSLDISTVAASVAAAPQRDLIITLLLSGFGIKAGAVPLHVWLPLAHPVAPTPASAVLSGSMIKAGLLGWLRFLPLGEAALPTWSATLVVLGLIAAFFGVLIGLAQRDPKTLLAYSSISQMGFLNVAVGLGLGDPARWRYALTACLVYAVHHGLAKGALFLGVGVVQGASSRRLRFWSLVAIGFAGLTVAGAPLTSGSAAKYLLKYAAPAAPGAWPDWLDMLLPLAAVGTTLLMGRFLVLLSRTEVRPEQHPVDRRMLASWGLLLGSVAVVVWLLPGHFGLDVRPPFRPAVETVWVAIWPVVAGAVLLWTLLWLSARTRVLRGLAVAPGDLLLVAEGLAAKLWRLRKPSPREGPGATPVNSLASEWYGLYARSDRRDRALRLEVALTRWAVAALLGAALLVSFFLLLARGGSG
jgi:formate hydrogenlyase subunit 3/multisubunit Na+/H+ antiporter MnhD subunit